jgi:hypothetical protein
VKLFPDVAAGSGSPDRPREIHRTTDELLLEQHTVSDGPAVSPIKEGVKHATFLSCLPSHLVDVCRPVKLCIKSHSRIMSWFGCLYWLSEELYWSVFMDMHRGLNREHSDVPRDVYGSPPIP